MFRNYFDTFSNFSKWYSIIFNYIKKRKWAKTRQLFTYNHVTIGFHGKIKQGEIHFFVYCLLDIVRIYFFGKIGISRNTTIDKFQYYFANQRDGIQSFIILTCQSKLPKIKKPDNANCKI